MAAILAPRRSAAILGLAEGLRRDSAEILRANGRDVAAATAAGLDAALIERLRLDDARVEKMAKAVEEIAAQPDPVGSVVDQNIRPNGLNIKRIRVPLGVVLFVYESRPNVTSDAAALALRSGNAIILRGGKESLHSNLAIGRIVRDAVTTAGLPEDAVQLVESTDRALLGGLLRRSGEIDLVIPRGGKGLITAVVDQARMPVLKHFDGNCHLYVDASAVAMPERVVEVCVNAKTSYPGGAVCNAVEKILFHEAAAGLIPAVCAGLAAKGVEIRGDESVRAAYAAAIPATEADWHAEYLSFRIALKVVKNLDAAIAHINLYGSRHTDGILTNDAAAAEDFTRRVDTASVMINASTRFADGGEYGLGAELGISTDKLHARGPMGAFDMTTTKWVVTGDFHCR